MDIRLITLNKMEESPMLALNTVNGYDENIILASRNLSNIALISADEINVLDLIAADKILVTKDAINQIEEVLA